jgi:thioredoxin-dependent peroxiredoxin
MTLEIGHKAPNFRLPAADQKSISLEDFLGKSVILYFYPKDMTSGCTAQACDFRDASADLSKLGVVVLGVSPDPIKSQAKFIEKEKLNFPLLSDADHAVSEKYGVWIEKSMYGRKYMGVDRSTFLIGPDGKIARIWRKVKVPGHVAQVLAAARELQSI